MKNNRFEHIAKKKESLDNFIEGANINKAAKIAKKSLKKENVLLSISGRMDRGKECDSKPILLHLKKDISQDIEKYCHGNKQAIINYLIRIGIDKLIEQGKLILVLE